MAYPVNRVKTWINGETLTHTDQNAEFDNILTNVGKPANCDDYSTNAAQMQSQTDPYPGSAESLATTLAGEIERIRYQLSQILGTTYWYQDANANLAATGSLTKANVTTTTATITDTISERTSAAGVTIDSVLLKDNTVTTTTLTANTSVVTDTISEKTATSGVTVDGVLCKDGGGNQVTHFGNDQTNKPSFSVHNNGVNITGIADDTATLITWSTELFDTHNYFASNKFTPLVSGKYLFSAGLEIEGTGLTSARLWLYKNGAAYQQFITQDSTGVGSMGTHLSVIADANGTTDYFEIYGQGNVSAGTVTIGGAASWTYFSGSRI